ncbi:hypothetical protein [Micromonospora sp. U21]|uniref:hypothetical protein n=1 Tax=Micromonospora sp. U21 TaxID=2824899 RepID=UPI001B362CBE|nr:hypothetical protein [Micromonospora sp. U21]MBQ0901281.1 hypothetical protein [Micromonospora sp. U21]
MGFRRSGRLVDRAVADRLLDAARPATPTEGAVRADPLAGLLAAAAAPARPQELAGEQAALAAFRAARAAPASAHARVPGRRRFTAGALAWVAGILATATAGAAFAAVTLDAPRETNPPPGPATPAPTTGHSGGSPSEGGAPTTGDRSGSPTAPSVPPSPSSGQAHTTPLGGLCRAHLAEQPDQRGKALKTPRFQPLVVAAGSTAQVDAYCQRLVPDAKPASKNGSGTKNSSSTGRGSGTAKKPGTTADPSRPAKVKPSHPVTGRPTETGVLTGPPHAAPPPSPGGGHDR